MKNMLKKLLHQFFEMPRLYKRIITVIFDIVIMLVAIVSAFAIRDHLVTWMSVPLYYSVAITIVASIFVWSRIGLYKAVIRFIDTKVLSTIFLGAIISGIVFVLVSYFLKSAMPRSVPFIYICLLLIFLGGSRLIIRGLINAQDGKARVPVVIYGAGSSGRQLALSLQHGAEFSPVAFIDDKAELQKMTVSGMRVYPRNRLPKIIKKYNVGKILLAMPSASAKQRNKIIRDLDGLSVEVLTIPGSADLVSGKLQIDTLRKVDIVDLLGREAVQPIDRLFRRCIESKAVMVTGAGGSIGSELCRQIVRQDPRSIILFESSEFALYSIEKELITMAEQLGSSIKIYAILGSVLEQSLIENIIKRFEINTIYHAAAYKHVPIVEGNVVSGIRNNVWGTKVCAEAANNCGVENFVLISTDKAVRPTNVMGCSKRMAELVLQSLSAKVASDETAPNSKVNKTNFSMVRFGNVLGSSGSVVPLFTKQIAEGGPVTITHADITRYFMTIPEAAQLVIQAGAMGQGGEVYVLDMGKPVKIYDLAQKMIHLTGLSIKSDLNPEGDIEIKFTGLRPGEKLYEELLIGENVEGTEHKRIMKAKEISMTANDLDDLLNNLNKAMIDGNIGAIRELLLKAPLGYTPSSEIADCLWLASDKKSKGDNAHAKDANEDKLRLVN